MINGISSYNNNSPAFTGISPKSIQNFIPEISSEVAQKISARTNLVIPKDHLEMMLSGGNTFTHLVEFSGMKIPVGDVTYKGADDIAEKITFLNDVVDLIKNGTLYA